MAIFPTDTANFPPTVLKQKKPVFVDFYAPWCGPCQTTAPIIDELSDEYQQMVFVKVNVDENPDLATQYGIFSIPTFIIFKEGKVVSQFSGANSKEAFVLEINKHLA